MKLNITTDQIESIQYMTLADAKEYALQILDTPILHEKAVCAKDLQKYVRLRLNVMSKRNVGDIVKMFYDMYLAGEGLAVTGSKWKRHYARNS